MMAVFYFYDKDPFDLTIEGDRIYWPAGHDYFIEPGVLNYDFRTDKMGPSWSEWLVPGMWRDDL